jgi:hypothetical protein
LEIRTALVFVLQKMGTTRKEWNQAWGNFQGDPDLAALLLAIRSLTTKFVALKSEVIAVDVHA